MDDQEIRVNLKGLDLAEEEVRQLEIVLQERFVTFLADRAKPHVASPVILGPGWIGIEMKTNKAP